MLLITPENFLLQIKSTECEEKLFLFLLSILKDSRSDSCKKNDSSSRLTLCEMVKNCAKLAHKLFVVYQIDCKQL